MMYLYRMAERGYEREAIVLIGSEDTGMRERVMANEDMLGEE